MSSVKKIGPDRWCVHLASESKSEVVVEVCMSREKAEKLRLAAPTSSQSSIATAIHHFLQLIF